MTDVNVQTSWQGNTSSESPPNAWNSDSPPTYSFSMSSGGSAIDAPLIFIGGSGFLNGTLHIPWTYILGSLSDLGTNINVSFDGGTTWTNTTVVAAHGGMSTSGTLSLPIPSGATGIKVDVGVAGIIG